MVSLGQQASLQQKRILALKDIPWGLPRIGISVCLDAEKVPLQC